MSKEEKKIHWHSPESCDIKDELCILVALNELADKCPDYHEEDEIIVAGPMNQPHPDDPPARMVMVTRSPLKPGQEFTEKEQGMRVFSTHSMIFYSDGTVGFGQGHYDMTFDQALDDLNKRTKEEKNFDFSKEGIPPYYVASRREKVSWHSPESCDIRDEPCVIKKLNKINTEKLETMGSEFQPAEIIVAGPMNQPHPDDSPVRIVMVTRSPLKPGQQFTKEEREKKTFSTYPIYYEEDGTIVFGEGHHEMTFEEAQQDFKERKEKVRNFNYSLVREDMTKPLTRRKKRLKLQQELKQKRKE